MAASLPASLFASLRRWLVPALLVGSALAFVLAHPPMVYGQPRFVGGVVMDRVWPDLALWRAALADGSLPLWDPWDRGGHPFFADPAAGAYDPITWLLVGVAVVLGSAPPWLAVLQPVLRYAILGSGMAMLLRRRGLPSWALAAATSAALWCPPLDALKGSAALGPTAWLPWGWVALDAAASAPSWRRGVWLGAAIAMMLDAGAPGTALQLLVLSLPWATVLVVRGLAGDRRADGGEDRRGDRRARGKALAVCLAVAAVVVLVMANAALSAGLSAPAAVPPLPADRTQLAHAWSWFSPGPSVLERLPYVGFALAAGVIAAGAARDRAEPLALTAAAALAFVIACGDATPIANWLAFVPALAEPDLAAAALMLAFAGALGLSRLTTLKGEQRWIGAFAAGFCLSALFTHGAGLDALGVLRALLSAGLLVGLAFVSFRWRDRLGWALLVVLAWDLLATSRPIADDLQPLPDARPAARLAAALDDEERAIYRVADLGWTRGRAGSLQQVRDMFGQAPAPGQERYETLHRLAHNSGNILRAMGVAVVGYEHRITGSELTRDLSPIKKRKHLYRVADPWPLAYWTDRVAVVDTFPEARVWVRMQREPTAAVERPDIPADVAIERYGSHDVDYAPDPRYVGARLLGWSSDALVLEVDAPRDGLLVVLEAWDPGWVAVVDGEPAPLLRANVLFRAVPLSAGKHRIELEYRPSGLLARWLLWLAALLTLLAIALRDRGKRTRRREAPG